MDSKLVWCSTWDAKSKIRIRNHPDAASRLTPVHQDDLNHPRRLLCMMIRTTSQHSLFPSSHLFLLCKSCKLCKCSSFYLKNTTKNKCNIWTCNKLHLKGLCNGPWVLAVDLMPWRKKAHLLKLNLPIPVIHFEKIVCDLLEPREFIEKMRKFAGVGRCIVFIISEVFSNKYSNAQIWCLGVSRFHLYFWHPKHFRFPCPVVSPACFSAKPRGTWTSLWCFMELFGATWTGEMPKTKTYGSGWVVKVVN